MARKVVWTQAAWADLEAAADYIAEDSPHYASAFVREVRDAARSLAHLIDRGRVVPELRDPSVRELLVRSYRLIYRATQGAVHILAFIHAARDLSSFSEREWRGS